MTIFLKNCYIWQIIPSHLDKYYKGKKGQLNYGKMDSGHSAWLQSCKPHDHVFSRIDKSGRQFHRIQINILREGLKRFRFTAVWPLTILLQITNQSKALLYNTRRVQHKTAIRCIYLPFQKKINYRWSNKAFKLFNDSHNK